MPVFQAYQSFGMAGVSLYHVLDQDFSEAIGATSSIYLIDVSASPQVCGRGGFPVYGI